MAEKTIFKIIVSNPPSILIGGGIIGLILKADWGPILIGLGIFLEIITLIMKYGFQGE